MDLSTKFGKEIPSRNLRKIKNRTVADVWEKDVWEFQAKSGSSSSCRLFLHFLGKIGVQGMSGKTPGSPRHPRPSEKGQASVWKKGKDPHPQDKIQHLDFTKDPRPLYYKIPSCAFYHKKWSVVRPFSVLSKDEIGPQYPLTQNHYLRKITLKYLFSENYESHA